MVLLHIIRNNVTLLYIFIYKISAKGIEVDQVKIEEIEKLPPPIDVKGVRSVLGHGGVYRRFIQDFSMIFKPLCNLLVKENLFHLNEEFLQAFYLFEKEASNCTDYSGS